MKIKITRFFEDTLSAKLKNHRWSWGAFDEKSNRLFLRIWEDEIRLFERYEKVRIYEKPRRNKSHGDPERRDHISLIRQGTKAFGILATAKDTKAQGQRQIQSFRHDVLVELGDLSEDADGIYARIVRRIPTNQVVATRS